MKNSQNIVTNLSSQEITEIPNQVNEIITKEINHENGKTIFSVADLWNIQKNIRTSFTKRRHYSFR